MLKPPLMVVTVVSHLLVFCGMNKHDSVILNLRRDSVKMLHGQVDALYWITGSICSITLVFFLEFSINYTNLNSSQIQKILAMQNIYYQILNMCMAKA